MGAKGLKGLKFAILGFNAFALIASPDRLHQFFSEL